MIPAGTQAADRVRPVQGQIRAGVVLTVLAGALLLLPVAPAAASTVSSSGTLLTAAQGETNNVVVTRTGSAIVITDTAGVTTTPPSLACTQDSLTQVTCTTTASPAAPFNVYARDGDDKVAIVGMGAILNGGPGNDLLD